MKVVFPPLERMITLNAWKEIESHKLKARNVTQHLLTMIPCATKQICKVFVSPVCAHS